MASEFAKLIFKFNTWKDEQGLNLDYPTSRGYGWRLGENAKAELSQHLETVWPEAPQQKKDEFKLCFETGKDLLGIPVLGTVPGDSVYLVKATEKPLNTIVKDVEFKRIESIVSQKQFNCPIAKKLFNWCCVIKLNSMTIQDSCNTYIDNFAGNYTGKIANESYEEGKVDTNDIHGISSYGLINYKTGVLEISRSDDTNIELLATLIEEHNTKAAGADSGESGTGSGESSESEDVEPVSSTKDDYNVTCTIYTDPVTKVWEYTLFEE